MEYRKLGRTGLKVSELCLGTMQFGWTADEGASKQILTAAYEAGINFIDTADIYSRWVKGNPGGIAESIIGDWIKESTIPRQNLIIATKVRGQIGNGPNDEGLSRAHIMQAVENSLLRLGTDYIDLYQTHWPDEDTPIEETLSALDDLTSQGKVRYIGCSNYPAWRLVDALWVAQHYHLTSYVSLQPHYNLVHRDEFERELADVCRHFNLGVLPYSPLAAGFLTGKYRQGKTLTSARAGSANRYFTDRNWALLEELETLGINKGGYSISQTALAWLLSNPLVTSPIIGPRSIKQLQDNLGSIDLKLDREERTLLDSASSWKR
jgi:aryl-alcohol dehydrogenase-like predicted oxidoreductase